MSSPHYVPQPNWPIYSSLILALLFVLLPFRGSLSLFLPNLVLLVLVYWALYRPESIGLGWAWITGLVQDLLMASLIGRHALIYLVVVFLIKYTLIRNKHHTFFEYVAWLMIFVLLDIVFSVFVDWSVHEIPPQWTVIYPVLGSVLLWPWLYAALSIYESFAAQMQH